MIKTTDNKHNGVVIDNTNLLNDIKLKTNTVERYPGQFGYGLIKGFSDLRMPDSAGT